MCIKINLNVVSCFNVGNHSNACTPSQAMCPHVLCLYNKLCPCSNWSFFTSKVVFIYLISLCMHPSMSLNFIHRTNFINFVSLTPIYFNKHILIFGVSWHSENWNCHARSAALASNVSCGWNSRNRCSKYVAVFRCLKSPVQLWWKIKHLASPWRLLAWTTTC